MAKSSVRRQLAGGRNAATVALFEAGDPRRIASVVNRDITRHLLMHGFAAVRDVWSRTQAGLLAKEAAALFSAGPAARDLGPPQQAMASDAPVLASLQFALLPTVRAMTGQLLVPSYGWYNFYATDDAIWLHIDVEESDLAILATAFGEAGPLHVHPHLSGLGQRELDGVQADPNWDRQGGIPIAYPRRGLLALRGRRLPHHRPGRSLSSPTAVIALHYKTLW